MYISRTLANQYSLRSNQTSSTRQTTAPAGTKKQPNFSDVLAKHDIRNATFAEFKQITKQLYQEGKITFHDYAIMTFNPEESPNPPKGSYWLTPSSAGGRRDWLAEWQARAERDYRLNNHINFNSNERILDILRRLAGVL